MIWLTSNLIRKKKTNKELPSLIFPTPSAKAGSRLMVYVCGKDSGECSFLWIGGVSRNICCLEIS